MAHRTTIDRTPPTPPIEDRDDGGGGGWVRLCTVGDRYEAEMIRGVLESEGLGPVVIEPVQMPGSWLLPSGHERLPQHLYVRRSLEQAARLALLEAGMPETDDPDAIEPAAAEADDAAIPSDARWERASRLIRWALLVALTGVLASYLVHLLGGEVGIPGG